MIPLIAPPEIFSAHAIAEDGASADLAFGTHLRIFAGLGASFPLTPFVVFRMTSSQSEPREIHISENRDPLIATLVPGSHTVRVDINDEFDPINYSALFDQNIRLIMARDRSPWMFSAPVLHQLRIWGGHAQFSIHTRSINLDQLWENPDVADVLALPVEGIHPWYVGMQNRDAGLARVERGAPLRLTPLDRPDGPFDPVGADAERARIEAMLGSWHLGGDLETLLMTMVDDTTTAPWSQLETSQMIGADGRKQWVKAPRLGTLQMASLDPGIARFLGFADRIEDFPDLEGVGGWDTLAVVGLFAIEPRAFERRGLNLTDPHHEADRLLETLVRALEDEGDVRGDIESVVDQARQNGLVTAPFVALTAPVPPPLMFSLSEPQIMQLRWQTAIDNNPSSLYRASFAFPDMPPYAAAAMAAQIDGVWVPRHNQVDLPPDFDPASRSIPRILGTERDTESRLRIHGGNSFSPAGLLSDENIPAGSITYRAWAADFFGRFGDPVEFQVEQPSRPVPPPPVLRFHVQRSELVVPNSLEALSPGVLKLTIAVPRPLPEDRFTADEESRLGSVILVPRLDDLAAGSLPIASLELSLDGQAPIPVDLSNPGFFEIEVVLPALNPQEEKTWILSGVFTNTAGTASETARLPVKATDRRPPKVYPAGIGLFWTSAPGPSREVELKLAWPASPKSQHRVYLTDQAGLNLAEDELEECESGMLPSRGCVAAVGCQKVLDQHPIERQGFRLLTEPPVEAGDDGRAVLVTTLPRSLSTVQFLRIVPLGPDGAEPAFEECGIVPIAVPESRRPPAPRLDGKPNPLAGTALLRITADGFDLSTLRRDEPGLFSPGADGVEPPQYRIRRAIDAVVDPIYASIIGQGVLTWQDSIFVGEFIDDNGGRGLAPFVRYVYWAEVRLPPERRVPAGWTVLDPPGGVTVFDPANAQDCPRPLSLPSAARAVMVIPPDAPSAPLPQAIFLWRKPVNAEGKVEILIKIADLPRLHANATAPYRLAAWTQWSGGDIETTSPDGTWFAITADKFHSILVTVPAAVDVASPLTLRLAIIDPVGRMSDITTLDVSEGGEMPTPMLGEPEILLLDPVRNEGNFHTWEGLVAFQWQVQSPIFPELADQYRVRFAFIDPDPMIEREPYFELVVALSDVETVESPLSLQQINATGQPRGIVRVADAATVTLIGWSRSAYVNAEFGFSLQDPDGQSVEVSWTLV